MKAFHLFDCIQPASNERAFVRNGGVRGIGIRGQLQSAISILLGGVSAKDTEGIELARRRRLLSEYALGIGAIACRQPPDTSSFPSLATHKRSEAVLPSQIRTKFAVRIGEFCRHAAFAFGTLSCPLRQLSPRGKRTVFQSVSWANYTAKGWAKC